MVDSSNNVLSAFSLTNNPSASSAQLVLPSNSLSYGIYAIKYTATLNVITANPSVHTSSLTVYVKVLPAGIVVRGLSNGVQSTTIGNSQSISIEPAIFSYDLDSTANIKTLPYKFYCRQVNSGVYGSYPTYANLTMMDLRTQKEGAFAYSEGCFTASSKFDFS